MPGATFMPTTPSGIPGSGQQPAAAPAGSPPAARVMGMPIWSPAFVAWVVVFGLVVPAVILGGLRFGGFRFVFLGR